MLCKSVVKVVFPLIEYDKYFNVNLNVLIERMAIGLFVITWD